MSEVMNVIEQNDGVRMLVRNVTIYQISGSNLYFHEVFKNYPHFIFQPLFERFFSDGEISTWRPGFTVSLQFH